MTASLDERLRRLARWADRFADPGFSFGVWVPATRGDDGVITVGWYEFSDAGQEFVSEMYRLGWIREFDWMAWLGTEEGQRLSRGRGAIPRATADDLARLLTAVIRSERFGDGQLEGAFESGILRAIARRAGELVELRR